MRPIPRSLRRAHEPELSAVLAQHEATKRNPAASRAVSRRVAVAHADVHGAPVRMHRRRRERVSASLVQQPGFARSRAVGLADGELETRPPSGGQQRFERGTRVGIEHVERVVGRERGRRKILATHSAYTLERLPRFSAPPQ